MRRNEEEGGLLPRLQEAEEQELGTHGREEGSLQRHWEAGTSDSSQLFHRGAPPVKKMLGDLAARNLPLGRTGVEQRHGQWETMELGGAWYTINRGYKDPWRHPHNCC